MKEYTILAIDINDLSPFPNHPFKLYEGERFDDMVLSITERGILEPIIVRTAENGKYEILSGHNRVNAAKKAGLTEVPAIVRDGLSDDEARLIVTETNLLQRSFDEMSHSEKAISLKFHVDAIKEQGKRVDLLAEIEKYVNAIDDEESTSGRVVPKLDAREKAAQKYKMGARNVSRYIKLCDLIVPLMSRLDNGEMAFTAALALSYLSGGEQAELEKILAESTKYKVDMPKAETLRDLARNQKLNAEDIRLVLSDGSESPPEKYNNAKIRHATYLKYFKNMEKAETALIIDAALEMYFKAKKSEQSDG